jgi:hypothetical protein
VLRPSYAQSSSLVAIIVNSRTVSLQLVCERDAEDERPSAGRLMSRDNLGEKVRTQSAPRRSSSLAGTIRATSRDEFSPTATWKELKMRATVYPTGFATCT